MGEEALPAAYVWEEVVVSDQVNALGGRVYDESPGSFSADGLRGAAKVPGLAPVAQVDRAQDS